MVPSQQVIQDGPKVKFKIFRDEPFVDLSLYQFGYEKCEPMHSFGPYIRNHYLFHYVIKGKGTFSPNDSKGGSRHFELREGEGFMIFPHQITEYAADMREPWEYIWLEFDGLKVKEALRLAGINDRQPIFRSKTREGSHRVHALMQNIVDAENSTHLYLIAQAYLFLDQLAQSSVHGTTESGGKLRNYYMKETIYYIENYYYSPITVESMARNCGLNRSYFSKLFKEAMGQSPQTFLMNYRMTRAADMLRHSTSGIGEIANAVGYPNPLHFTRAFKNRYGVSPSAWRAQHGS